MENVYKTPGYNFVSLLVLDAQGEATPVIQAISANDFTATAKILLDTLRALEPDATRGIHCLMTSEALEDPFIVALANVLPQNSELTTYPSRVECVQPYEYVVQSSLKLYR